MPYANFAQTYGYRPSVRGLTRGEVDIGLLACLNKVTASGILIAAQGITAALDSDAYMAVLQASGASNKQLQDTELQILKSKNATKR
jgi:hypothetical protein